ncbi:uncharacterized protein M6D78_005578 [Vipera latastei]
MIKNMVTSALYIDQWGNALDERSDDLLQCQAEMIRLCVARPMGKKLRVVFKRFKDINISETKVSDAKKEVLFEEEEVILRPPPCVPQPPPLPPPAAVAAASGEAQPVVRRKFKGKVPMAPKDEEESSVAESGEPSEGIGNCNGNHPLSFYPEYWNYSLPHPCQYPQAFDRIAKDARQARQPATFEASICNRLSLIAERRAITQIMVMWDFHKEQLDKQGGEYVALLVDSEEPQRGEYEIVQTKVPTQV